MKSRTAGTIAIAVALFYLSLGAVFLLFGEQVSPTSANEPAIHNSRVVIKLIREPEGTFTLPYYPADYTETIVVGSTDRFDNRSSFSSYGAHIDLVAPGSSISFNKVLTIS